MNMMDEVPEMGEEEVHESKHDEVYQTSALHVYSCICSNLALILGLPARRGSRFICDSYCRRADTRADAPLEHLPKRHTDGSAFLDSSVHVHKSHTVPSGVVVVVRLGLPAAAACVTDMQAAGQGAPVPG